MAELACYSSEHKEKTASTIVEITGGSSTNQKLGAKGETEVKYEQRIQSDLRIL
jgi:hypothetical protein